MIRTRVKLVREDIPDLGYRGRIKGPSEVAAMMTDLTKDSTVEEFWLFCLDTKHELCGYQLITRGILDASLIHPREVFQPAILSNAAAIIVAHNHPSGNLDISAEDRQVSTRLREAGKLLMIPLLDSLIVNHDGDYISILLGDQR